MTHPEEAHIEVERWLEEFIIDLNLCPFARGPYSQGRVAIVSSGAAGYDSAFADAVNLIDDLLECDAEELSTTLIVYPNALQEFDDLLDLVADLEMVLEQSGGDQLVQLAHFHPNYLFEDEAPDDPSHYTNRAPYPIVHLLRVEEVADAITSMPGVHEIPERNIELMRTFNERQLNELTGSNT